MNPARTRFPVAASLLAGLLAPGLPAAADTQGERLGAMQSDRRERTWRVDEEKPPLQVVAVVRDFRRAHPDFQRSVNFGLHTGIVAPRLDRAGKPLLSEEAASSTDARRQVESPESFHDWYRSVRGVNMTFRVPLELDHDPTTGLYTFQRNIDNGDGFFPLDGVGFPEPATERYAETEHNFFFTTEVKTAFRYTDPATRPERPMKLRFVGDDDVWVFVNNQLVLDLGGIHSQVEAEVNIDELAGELGLRNNGEYSLRVFHAERHYWQSNFMLQTSIALAASRDEPLYD